MGLRRGARTSVIGPIYFRCISFSGWLGPEQVTQDLTHYTNEYYQRELTFCRYGILRSDQLAALCYILDWAYWGPKTEAAVVRGPPTKVGSVVSSNP